MNKLPHQKVRIAWRDAVLFSRETASVMRLKPTSMITRGILVKETRDGVFIKDPHTINGGTKRRVEKERGATFLFVPRGMIQKIEK
jgi:hypothetical protein